MISLVVMLLAAEPAPQCARDSDCEVTTVGSCCDCCPVEPHAAPKDRCRGLSCPARACPKSACKKVSSTAGLTAECREGRCALVKPP